MRHTLAAEGSLNPRMRRKLTLVLGEARTRTTKGRRFKIMFLLKGQWVSDESSIKSRC